jgi:hypothetical protein
MSRKIPNFYLTLAEIKASKGPEPSIAYCTETRTQYEYVSSGASLIPDDTSILTTGDGGDTRWKGVSGNFVAVDSGKHTSIILGDLDSNLNIIDYLSEQGQAQVEIDSSLIEFGPVGSSITRPHGNTQKDNNEIFFSSRSSSGVDSKFVHFKALPSLDPTGIFYTDLNDGVNGFYYADSMVYVDEAGTDVCYVHAVRHGDESLANAPLTILRVEIDSPNPSIVTEWFRDATYAVDAGGMSGAIETDGTYLYISAEEVGVGNKLLKIEISSGTVVDTTDGWFVSHNLKRYYDSVSGRDELYGCMGGITVTFRKIDLTNWAGGTTEYSLPVSPNTIITDDICVHPDGTFVYAACESVGRIFALNISTGEITEHESHVAFSVETDGTDLYVGGIIGGTQNVITKYKDFNLNYPQYYYINSDLSVDAGSINEMAFDDDYIYGTVWQSDTTFDNRIRKIPKSVLTTSGNIDPSVNLESHKININIPKTNLEDVINITLPRVENYPNLEINIIKEKSDCIVNISTEPYSPRAQFITNDDTSTGAYEHTMGIGVSKLNLIANSTPIYEVGDTGPAGGTIFMVPDGGVSSINTTGRYFEFSDTYDYNASINKWSEPNIAVSEAQSGNLGDGLKNTKEIYDALVADGQDIVDRPVVRPFQHSENGYNDFYAPTQDEIAEIYEQRSILGLGSEINTFWTSTEFATDDTMAYACDFNTGGLVSEYTKDTNNHRSFAIRSFIGSHWRLKETKASLSDFVNRIIVGSNGDFDTLKEAVDWFNASATSNIDILLDAGTHDVADTIEVNNATYNLSIKGMGFTTSILQAATGLTNKPMFMVKSGCEIGRLGAVGSTLANYGDLADENFITLNGLGDVFLFLDNVMADTFNIGIEDTSGDEVLLVDFFFKNMAKGVAVEHSNANTEITDLERGTMENCAIGIDLIEAPDDTFIIRDVVFVNPIGGIAIKYNSANYGFSEFSEIMGCTFNNVGTFLDGFDWTAASDANIVVLGNVGVSNNTPIGGMSAVNNTDGTLCANSNTWYLADLGTAATIGPVTGDFTFTVGGSYSSDVTRDYVIKITAGDPTDPNTFQYSDDGGVTYNGTDLDCSTSPVALNHGLTVTFASATGFTTDDEATFTANGYSVSTILTKFTVPVGTKKLKYMSDIVSRCTVDLTASIASSVNNRTLRVAVVKNGDTTDPVAAFSMRMAGGSGVPVNISVKGCSEVTEKDDEFEVYLNCTSAGNTTFTVQDIQWRLTAL